MDLTVDAEVEYTLSAYDARAVVEQGLVERGVAPAGQTCPARVVAVPELTVVATADLAVTVAEGVEYAASNRTIGDGVGYWHWPY